MELLDLLGNEDSDVKRAIKYLLDTKIKEASWYKKEQYFCWKFLGKKAEIDYCSQRDHAIDWFFSKALWSKTEQEGNEVAEFELEKVIKNIQCAPLIVYLAIVTNLLTEEEAKRIVEQMAKELESSKQEITSRNIRFYEKKELLSSLKNDDWAKNIYQNLIKNR